MERNAHEQNRRSSGGYARTSRAHHDGGRCSQDAVDRGLHFVGCVVNDHIHGVLPRRGTASAAHVDDEVSPNAEEREVTVEALEVSRDAVRFAFDARTDGEVYDRPCHEDLIRCRNALHTCGEVDAEPADVVAAALAWPPRQPSPTYGLP